MLGKSALKSVADGAEWITGELSDPTVGDLSRYHLGTTPRVYAGPERAVLLRVDDRLVIGVRGDLTREQAQFDAAHELGHWFWEDVANYRGVDLEARCDALAAALVAPPHAVRSARKHHGDDVAAIADTLGTTQSVALLRLGEVCDVPVALLRRRRSTIIRGPFVTWPVPLSWQPAKNAPGLAKVRITDEPARFGVIG